MLARKWNVIRIIACCVSSLLMTSCAFSLNNPVDCLVNQTPFGGGSGTSADPYRICSVQQLENVANYLSSSFQQYANLDLTNNTTFAPIGSYGNPFTGSYNGGGYSISNWTYGNSTMNNLGFFGTISSSATLSNINLFNFNLTGGGGVGALVGLTDSNSVSIQISNCSSTGQITAHSNSGGLIGSIQSAQITQSGSSAQIDCVSGGGCGGLIGIAHSITVSNSYATGTVMATGQEVGGFIGQATNATLSNSYATGNVTAAGYVGGLVGLNLTGSSSCGIATSYATGNVTATSAIGAGGLIGALSNCSITNSYATSNVSGTSYVGGLTGVMNSSSSSISESYATGTVSGSGSQIGGLVGIVDSGTITSSYSTSTVNSSASGGTSIGGLIGILNSPGPSTISNSYATGAVSASLSSDVGGLVGASTGANSTITNSYSIGVPTGSSNVGGLLGTCGACGTITSSYWNLGIYGSSAGGTGLTTSQMQSQSNFVGWDFTATWMFPGANSYPILQWQ